MALIISGQPFAVSVSVLGGNSGTQGSDTNNRANGRTRTGSGDANMLVPVIDVDDTDYWEDETPASSNPTRRIRREPIGILTQSLDDPALVNGQP